jgi:ribonuclease-3
MGITQLIMSSGHSSSHNSYMGGNAFEALVGAIYLDRGYDACMRLCRTYSGTTDQYRQGGL